MLVIVLPDSLRDSKTYHYSARDSCADRDFIRSEDAECPPATGTKDSRIQLVVETNLSVQHLRYRAAGFRFLDNAVKDIGFNARQNNLTLQRHG